MCLMLASDSACIAPRTWLATACALVRMRRCSSGLMAKPLAVHLLCAHICQGWLKLGDAVVVKICGGKARGWAKQLQVCKVWQAPFAWTSACLAAATAGCAAFKCGNRRR